MAGKVILLNPPFATVFALVWFVKDVYLDVFLVLFWPLERSVAVGAFVWVAKNVGSKEMRELAGVSWT